MERRKFEIIVRFDQRLTKTRMNLIRDVALRFQIERDMERTRIVDGLIIQAKFNQ